VTSTDDSNGETPTLGEAALRYVQQGIYVFPARVTIDTDGRKIVAPIANWRNASTTDPSVIASWWGPGGSWVGSSICIDTGRSGLVVVDIDQGADVGSVLEALGAHPVVASTPSGGLHVYYRANPSRPLRNTTSKLAEHVDTRADGGFVFAPPSVDARGAYAWRTGGIADIPPVPVSVIEGTIRRERPAPERVSGVRQSDGARLDLTDPRAVTRALAYGRTALEGECRKLASAPDGTRNATAYNVACCLWENILGGTLDEQTAYEAFADAAEIASGNGAAAFDPREAWSVWRKASNRSTLTPRRLPDDLFGGEVFGTQTGTLPSVVSAGQPSPVDPAGARRPSRVRDLRPHLSGERERVKPSVGLHRNDGLQLFYRAKWHTVIAPNEAGKSLLACFACAEELWRGNAVAYLHFEETGEGAPDDTIDRLRALGVADDMIEKGLKWFDCGEAPWSADAIRDELGAFPQAPSLVICDGINEMCGQHGWNPDRPEAVTAFRAAIATPFMAAGAAVVCLGHPPKARDRQSERHGFGSTAWLDMVNGSAYRMESGRPRIVRTRKGASNVWIVKDRPGGIRPECRDDATREGWAYVGAFVVDDTRSEKPDRTVAYLTIPKAPEGDEGGPCGDAKRDPIDSLCEKIVKRLEAVEGHSFESQSELIDNLRAAGASFTTAYVGAAITRLIWSGRIESVENGRKVGGRLVEPTRGERQDDVSEQDQFVDPS
jgi:hypothetical protein